MSQVERAKKLVDQGFAVFPLQPNGKKPVIDAFTEQAATDSKAVEKLWIDSVLEVEQPYNIGIATTRYRNGSDHEALLVVDVDVKKGKDGIGSLNALELNGKTFPKTLEQSTPSGGLHMIYKVKEAVSQGTNVLGDGLDVRSKGGYIVAAGSEINGRLYEINDSPIAEAPAWMVEVCNAKRVTARKKKKRKTKPNTKAAIKRVTEYLSRAKPAVSGQGGDERAFKVASRCKDLGVDEAKALELMIDHWNERCSPPWGVQELEAKIQNAFQYGQNEEGCDAPESEFEAADEPDEAISPVREINKTFSFAVIGGKSTIIKQTDKEAIFMNVNAFHDLLKSQATWCDGKYQQVSDLWMKSELRSTYDRVEMLPGQEAPKDTYNLWRGFSCEPLAEGEEITPEMEDGVAAFHEHARANICLDDQILYGWMISYFAHMIQKPHVKPSTALVFKGDKGVGKNALIDRVGNLFRANYLLTSNKRYLTSNFNSHLSRLLLFVLDEAFWSGDKGAEGVLKDLITGNQHLIEQKGREMYVAKNLTRVCIIGNEDWLVPSSQDERRFAVFNVGAQRQQDTKFFQEMRTNIDDKGGNRLLLRQLMDHDLSGFNPNRAPETEGLLDQKIESLNPVHAWWHQCLQDGQIEGLAFDSSAWPTKPVARHRLREAFGEYAKERGIRSWLPSSIAFGKALQKACPGLENSRIGRRGERQWASGLPTLNVAREQFESFMRQPLPWPTDPDDELNELLS